MELFYIALFGVAALLSAGLEYGNRIAKGAAQATSPEFTRFKNNYLIVYSVGLGGVVRAEMCGRWLAGLGEVALPARLAAPSSSYHRPQPPR